MIHQIQEQYKEQEIGKTIQTIREDAREHVGNGAVTSAYTADREKVVQFLNESLVSLRQGSVNW